MKKILLTTMCLVVVTTMVFFVFSTIYAAEYTLLTPLPGTVDNAPIKLGDYLPAVFNLAIGIAAVMAFVAITWGGITYATSDAITGKAQGREWITNAIWGLLLVIGAWVILYTINPQILKFNLILETPNVQAGEPTVTAGGVGGVSMTSVEQASDATIRTDLTKAGFTFNHDMCTTQYQKNCTNVNNLPPNTVIALETLIKDCGCNIQITGGTETNTVHKTHGPGQTAVDLTSDSLTSWFVSKGFMRVGEKAASVKLSNGQVLNFLYEAAGEGSSTGNHWHKF